MKIDIINRVSFFMNMCLAGAKLDCEANHEELSDTTILFSYMGNGASDSLTVKNIKQFLEEVKALNGGKLKCPECEGPVNNRVETHSPFCKRG